MEASSDLSGDPKSHTASLIQYAVVQPGVVILIKFTIDNPYTYYVFNLYLGVSSPWSNILLNYVPVGDNNSI